MTDRNLRKDAMSCLRAGLLAVDPEHLVGSWLREHAPLEGAERVHLLAVGKAAAGMARGALGYLGARCAGGVVLTTAPAPSHLPETLRVLTGGHPEPDDGSLAGARQIHQVASGLGRTNRLLVLLSGGASALMTLPPRDVSLEDVRETTGLLLRAGATIRDLNCVRKHLDRLKGGRLAAAAAPAAVLGLVLSDVVGDPLDVIASGPLTPDSTTFADALEVLDRLDLRQDVPRTVRRHLERGESGKEDESPAVGDECFATTEVVVVGNNLVAIEAASRQAGELGYSPIVLTTELEGEARDAGGLLAQAACRVVVEGEPAPPPVCLLAAGETTVTVHGDGTGGRNQELVLGAAIALAGSAGLVVGSLGTDGRDGPTDAAGALADGTTLERASRSGIDARRTLERNDSHALFEALGDLIVTGPTGTNVMDLQVVMIDERATVPEAELATVPEATATTRAAAGAEVPGDQPETDGEPEPGVGWTALGLSHPLIESVLALGFARPMPIQVEVIPRALEQRDVVGLAETGSGKTAAFCLPIAERLLHGSGIRGLIVCPTREIAMQTTRFLETFGRDHELDTVEIIGGMKMGPQVSALRRDPDILVATPGRLLDHVGRGTLDLGGVEELVLDEADHMLDLGFLPQIQAILEELPAERRTMMFSATMPPLIRRLADRFMRDPVVVDLRPEGGAAEGIEHQLYLVEEDDKKPCLLALLADDQGSTLVFMRRKVDADWASRQLELAGHPVDRIHSDRSQRQRIEALEGFRSGEHRVLVATDVAARGIDIPRIEHIVNFDMPETVEDYIHRAGRTARGDRKGVVSTIATWRDRVMVRRVEAALGIELPRCTASGVEAYKELGGRRRKFVRRRLL